MEQNFSNLFEDIRHERSLIILLSLTDPDILKQSKFTDDEIIIIKNLALEEIHRQKNKGIVFSTIIRIVFSV